MPEQRIRDNFHQQGLMHTLGAEIRSIEPGRVVLQCAFRPELAQQNGFFHAGVLTSLADSACGYAALTRMPAGADVLSVEFKINLLRPARTDLILATGLVLKAGRTLTICEGIVTDLDRGVVFAKMMATMMAVIR